MVVEAAVTEAPERVKSLTRMGVLGSDQEGSNRPLVLAVELSSDRHPAAVYLARLAPGSRRTMRAALDLVAEMLTSGAADARTLDWSAVRYQHAQAVRSRLTERYKPASANKTLSAIRGVLREAWRLGLTSSDDYRRAADVEAVKGETVPPGRALTAGELKSLLAACSADDTAAGTRDAGLLALLYVRHTKGNRERVVYVGRLVARPGRPGVRGRRAPPHRSGQARRGSAGRRPARRRVVAGRRAPSPPGRPGRPAAGPAHRESRP